MRKVEKKEIEDLDKMFKTKRNVVELDPLFFQYLEFEENIYYGEYTSSHKNGLGRMEDVINQFVDDSEFDLKELSTCFVMIETPEGSGLLMEEINTFFKKLTDNFNSEAITTWSYALNNDIANGECNLIVVVTK